MRPMARPRRDFAIVVENFRTASAGVAAAVRYISGNIPAFEVLSVGR